MELTHKTVGDAPDDLNTPLKPCCSLLSALFNFVFSVVGDEVPIEAFVRALEIPDAGEPFESIGREIGLRYAWRDNSRSSFTMFSRGTANLLVPSKPSFDYDTY
jgi:hypothetical protein